MPYSDDHTSDQYEWIEPGQWDDTDSWTDSEEDYSEEEETGYCRLCDAEISAMAEVCPVCGHWFSERERRAMNQGARATEVIKTVGYVAMVIIGVMLALSMLAQL